MSSTEEREHEARHAAAMQIVEDTALAFKRGAVSFNRAKSIIDDALIGDADRIVKIGNNKHTPEIES
jgi:hypothetical protein